MESESLEFHERVRATFRELAQQRGSRYVVCDATLPVDEVATMVRLAVERRLGSKLFDPRHDHDPRREPVAT